MLSYGVAILYCILIFFYKGCHWCSYLCLSLAFETELLYLSILYGPGFLSASKTRNIESLPLLVRFL
jgi:hypothetical protein